MILIARFIQISLLAAIIHYAELFFESQNHQDAKEHKAEQCSATDASWCLGGYLIQNLYVSPLPTSLLQ